MESRWRPRQDHSHSAGLKRGSMTVPSRSRCLVENTCKGQEFTVRIADQKWLRSRIARMEKVDHDIY
ncbi:hypothetical protein EVAR_98028_1 [Eumeta japonica]|uniref:Uncharacterized protein n=1 Tax=Eumeta variegata TaxID=151549 RepID=A0A4C1ZRR4_EUMVA|nr:hypothetical protein EVAR_98028_1 [Eumeta japonica]